MTELGQAVVFSPDHEDPSQQQKITEGSPDQPCLVPLTLFSNPAVSESPQSRASLFQVILPCICYIFATYTNSVGSWLSCSFDFF